MRILCLLLFMFLFVYEPYTPFTVSVAVCVFLLFAAAALVSAEPAAITLTQFRLVGNLTNDQALFTLTATAQVENPKGGSLELLSGAVALTETGSHEKYRIHADQKPFRRHVRARWQIPGSPQIQCRRPAVGPLEKRRFSCRPQRHTASAP